MPHLTRENAVEDEITICEAFLSDGSQCGREFPDEVAWMEHFEASHLDDDSDEDPPRPG
jgi:hypothetical protein